MLSALLRLVLVAQYLISPSLIVDSKFVRRHDNYALTGVSNKTMLKRGVVLLRHFQTHRVDKVGMSP